MEGVSFAHWILMDYGDMVVHVFDDETRAFYELEKFWLDAPRIPYEEGGEATADAETANILGGEDERALPR